MVSLDTLSYTPREISRPTEGSVCAAICGRLKRACLTDCGRLGAYIRRWWVMTTDFDFLVSGASRRDLWKVLLPLPGVLAMFSDIGLGNVVVLDAAVAILLVAASFLPAGALWPDFLIAGINASYVTAHCFLNPLGDFTLPGYRVLILFSMSTAGVHSVALTAFVAVGMAVAPMLAMGWQAVHIASCLYVLLVSIMVERRIAQLVSDKNANIFSYKALDMVSNSHGSAMYAQGAGGDGAFMPAQSRTTADPLSRGDETLAQASSRGSMADSMLSRVNLTDNRGSVADMMFSRLTPATPDEEALQVGRQASPQVLLPGAATHEAAKISNSDRLSQAKAPGDIKVVVGPEDATACSIPCSPTSSQKSPQTQFRAVKMTGFKNPGLNDMFIENSEPSYVINERETYWSSKGDFFLYRSAATNTWGAAKAKRFQNIKDGKSNGVAHSPEGFGLWDSGKAVQMKKAWREWDADASKWMTRQGSGVESRGKVRKKEQNVEKSTQTQFSAEAKATQTEPREPRPSGVAPAPA